MARRCLSNRLELGERATTPLNVAFVKSRGFRGRRSSLTAAAVIALLSWIASPKSSDGLASRSACSHETEFEALMAREAAPHASAGSRLDALKQAVRLCPSDPQPYRALAALLLEQQKFQQALLWIHRGLQANPCNPELSTELGAAFLAAGQPERALAVLKPLPETARNDFYLGMAYRALNEHAAAQRALARSFKMGNRDPYVLYALIEQDRALQDTQAGLRDFKALYQTFPHSPWLYMLLGYAYEARNDSEKAMKEYRYAASMDPTVPVVRYLLGRIAFDQANYPEAIKDFREEIANDPSFGSAYLYLGVSLRRTGKNKEALPYLQDSVTRDPSQPLVYEALASALIEAGQLHEALRTLAVGEREFPRNAAFPAQLSYLMRRLGDDSGANKQAALAESLSRKHNPGLPGVVSRRISRNSFIQRVPHPAPTHHFQVHPLLQAGEGNAVREARAQIRALSQCVARSDAACASVALSRLNDPRLQQNAAYLNLKARALNLLRRRKEALAAAQDAVRIDPKQPAYFITQGRIEQRMGNEAAAIRSFLRAEQSQPGAAAPFYDVGMSFFLMGRNNNQDTFYRRAAQNFKTALELDPHNDKAEFMLGGVAVIESRLDEAKQDFQRAIQMSPSNPYYHLHYGKVLYRLGEVALARREMEIAERLDPSYAPSYFNLGDLLAQSGSLKQAREQLEKGARLEPNFAPTYYTLGRVDYRLGLRAQAQAAFQKYARLQAQKHLPHNRPLSQAQTPPESKSLPAKP
ncbi:MAG: tetratricopeptide repeat protein [Terriglobia bacterium]